MMRMPPTLAAGIPPIDGSPIRWVAPAVDDLGDVTIGYYGGWAIQLRLAPLGCWLALADPAPGGAASYRWRYRRAREAHLAALAWDPERECEPDNYTRAKGGIRLPAERARWWHPPMA
jgi:hypothetical protein